ncbi:MAG: HD domain-containing protein [Tissierellia bacterium]|nr:HD domain-containing protein [Tissierellia bacterium]
MLYEDVLKILHRDGKEAYVVGGTVRDMILNRPSYDVDITTSARQEDLERLFPSGYSINATLGTWILPPKEEGEVSIEITPYRREGKYLDYRRPSMVSYTPRVEEDVQRRDFTINGLLYDPNQGIVDLVDGLKDIERGIIRAIGEPEDRFEEDALRMLRGIRFATELGFQIEKRTLDAIVAKKELIYYLSMERIAEEFEKILLSDRPNQGLTLLRSTGVLDYILPELIPTYDFDQGNRHHRFDLWTHTLVAVEHTPKVRVLRWAALLHDIGKPETKTIDEDGESHYYGHDELSAKMASDILKRYCLPFKVRNRILDLIALHMRVDPQMGKRGIRNLVRRLGEDGFEQWLELTRADSMASHGDGLAIIDKIAEIKDNMSENNEAFTLKDLAVNGGDILALGVKEGPQVGRILEWLFQQVDHGVPNEKFILMQLVKRYREEL